MHVGRKMFPEIFLYLHTCVIPTPELNVVSYLPLNTACIVNIASAVSAYLSSRCYTAAVLG